LDLPRIYRDRFAIASVWPSLRAAHHTIVFTNGCFDILHAGHVDYLERARALGDLLVLGLNDDASIRRLKGEARPINPFEDRARVLSALRSIDLVVGFAEDTPLDLIAMTQPDVLVKGGDWRPDQIVGAEIVTARGGRVLSLPFVEGRSTTGVIERILERSGSSAD
jgi:D-beta-D-heptose 7-phosphate kinase/D-beta-D-heptose 1-phosphate adenosyltransferase